MAHRQPVGCDQVIVIGVSCLITGLIGLTTFLGKTAADRALNRSRVTVIKKGRHI